jgi:hypothetical protein
MVLQTFKDHDVNKISATLKKYLNDRPLKGNVKYRMLNGTKNIDPKAVVGKDDYVFPSITQIILRARLKDPETKQPVEVAHVKTMGKDNVEAYGVLNVPDTNRGVFVLHEGIMDEEEIYHVVELLNENASNPHRDQSVNPVFERVDEVSLSKAKVAKRSTRIEMLKYIDILDPIEKRILYAANGGGYDDDIDVVTDKLQELAEKDADWFKGMVENNLTPIKAIVKQALEKGHIQYDAQTHQYRWVATGDNIVSLDRVEGVAPAQQFAEWLDTSKNGEAITKQMKNLISPKEEPKTGKAAGK